MCSTSLLGEDRYQHIASLLGELKTLFYALRYSSTKCIADGARSNVLMNLIRKKEDRHSSSLHLNILLCNTDPVG